MGAAPPRWFVLVASGSVGFVFFLMELVWYRRLAPILGGTVFTMGLILSIPLLGIAIGGLAHAAWSSRRPATLRLLSWTCALEAAALGLAFALGDRLAISAARWQSQAGTSFSGQVLGWAVVASVVALPASVFAGVQFPTLIGLLGRGRERLAQQTGQAYMQPIRSGRCSARSRAGSG